MLKKKKSAKKSDWLLKPNNTEAAAECFIKRSIHIA